MALSDAEQEELLTKTRQLHDQLIGTKTSAPREALRQLLREDAADSDAVEKRTRP